MSSKKPHRLIRTARVDLPVAEASGLAVRFVDGRAQVILVADTATEKLVAQIRLVAPPDSPLHDKWDDPSSRGEGLVLLRGGRLLVAKEKRPRALIEFTPKGVNARGLSRDDFLAAGEAWEAPDGNVDYAATAMWRLRGPAKDALHDISALAVGPDRSLWLLSDKSRSVARLSLDTPLQPSDDKIRNLQEMWRLPKHTKKPEGVAAIDEDHILIAMDTKSMLDNGIIAQRPPP